MTREELIEHLEHLEKYTHYSEDAPALREVIEMLKCSEMPNSSEERTNKRTETHACDCISRRESTIGQVNESAQSTNDLIIRKAEIDPKDAVSAIENLSSAQPDHIVEVSKKVECPTFEDSSQYAQPDNRLSKIAELVEGTIDHFDLDDAMDLLYQIKEIVGNETSNIRG